MRNVQETFTKIVEEVPYLPEELQLAVCQRRGPERAAATSSPARCA